jgi:hypothetical protein
MRIKHVAPNTDFTNGWMSALPSNPHYIPHKTTEQPERAEGN